MKKIYITQRYLKRIKHNVEKIRYLLFSTRQRILGFRLSNKKHQRTNSTYFFILITSSPNCVSRLLFIRHIHSSPDAVIWFDKILRRRVYCRCDCISRHYIYIFFLSSWSRYQFWFDWIDCLKCCLLYFVVEFLRITVLESDSSSKIVPVVYILLFFILWIRYFILTTEPRINFLSGDSLLTYNYK